MTGKPVIYRDLKLLFLFCDASRCSIRWCTRKIKSYSALLCGEIVHRQWRRTEMKKNTPPNIKLVHEYKRENLVVASYVQ